MKVIMFEWIHRVPVELAYVSIAAAGGLARYLHIYLAGGPFSINKLTAHLMVSAFSGYMFFQFGLNILGAPLEAAAVIAGMGGWMGADAITLLEDWLQKRLNKKDNDTK